MRLRWPRCVGITEDDGGSAIAEFQYPAAWLADQRMFRRNAERREQLGGLDLPSARSASQQARHSPSFSPR